MNLKRIISNHASPKKTGICAWFWNVKIRAIDAGVTVGFLLYSICSVTATSKMSSFPNRCKSRDTYISWKHLNKQGRKLSQKTQCSATEKAAETIHPALRSCILKPFMEGLCLPSARPLIHSAQEGSNFNINRLFMRI